MVVGSGASLSPTGTGTVTASSLSGPFGIPVSAVVATLESTATSTYTDLITLGPAVTATVSASGRALVTLTAELNNNQNNRLCSMAFEVSGATPTIAASDTQALRMHSSSGATVAQLSATYLVTGLTAGNNTFTSKYKNDIAGTCTFANRNIIIIPY
jgi:hypothetical protein